MLVSKSSFDGVTRFALIISVFRIFDGNMVLFSQGSLLELSAKRIQYIYLKKRIQKNMFLRRLALYMFMQ